MLRCKVFYDGSNGAPAKWNTTGGRLKGERKNCCGEEREKREKERKREINGDMDKEKKMKKKTKKRGDDGGRDPQCI